MKNMVLRIITLMLITVISVAQFQNVKADNDNGAREIGIECVVNYNMYDIDNCIKWYSKKEGYYGSGIRQN